MTSIAEEKTHAEEVEAVEKMPDYSSSADVSDEPAPKVSFKTKMAILVASIPFPKSLRS